MSLAATFSQSQPLNVIRLNQSNLQDCLALQRDVLAALPPDQNKVHPKTRETFLNLLDDNNSQSTILGIFENGVLIAQAIMLRPETVAEADLLDFVLPAVPQDITTLAGVLTHPDYRSRGLMTRLVNAWLQIAKEEGRPHACSIVTRDNTESWSGFMNGGAVITAAGYDPSDDSTVYLMHRDLTRGRVLTRDEQSVLSACARSGEYHPVDYRILSPKVSLEEANKHFAEGYVGVERAYERDNPDVVLVHRACLDYYLGIK